MKVETFPIPAVFTYHWKGAEIIDLIRKHGPNQVRIALQEGSHCRTTSQVRANLLTLSFCQLLRVGFEHGATHS